MYFDYLSGEQEKSQPANTSGRLESLEKRVQELLSESSDSGFTEYLCQMKMRIINQQHQIDLLADELERRYRMYLVNRQGMTAQPVPQPMQYVAAQPAPRPVQYVAAQPAPQPVNRRKPDMEFAVGAAALSVVGGVFILTALVLLGINFMNGFVKGVSLYVFCLALILFSELRLYKKYPKMRMAFSAIGVGGLYVSTMINFLILKNFNVWVALGVAAAIAGGVIFLSGRRKTSVYCILGMALNTLFTFTACLSWDNGGQWETFAEMWHYPAFAAVSLLIMQLIFISQIRMQTNLKADSTLGDNAGICVVYGISSLFYEAAAVMVTDFPNLIHMEGMPADIYMIHRLVCAAITVCICALPLIALRKRQEKWFAWYLLNILLFAIYLSATDKWELSCCLAVLLVVSKLLTFTRKPMLCICDAVLTSVVCLMVLADNSHSYVIPMFAAVVFSLLCINYWKTYLETILTYTIAFYISFHMLELLKLPVFAGVLFMGMLLFNNAERWRGQKIQVFNWMMLAGQAVCYLLLTDPMYTNAYITYLCMLIFGVSTIVVCFQSNYQMDFAGKRLVLAVFLTYMALVVRTDYPIVNSILAMLIALISVGLGFAVREKTIRIYGLVLALTVCCKIVLYDFQETSILQKTIVFFAAGVLALIISAIYMVLEKKLNACQTESKAEDILKERGTV